MTYRQLGNDLIAAASRGDASEVQSLLGTGVPDLLNFTDKVLYVHTRILLRECWLDIVMSMLLIWIERKDCVNVCFDVWAFTGCGRPHFRRELTSTSPTRYCIAFNAQNVVF